MQLTAKFSTKNNRLSPHYQETRRSRENPTKEQKRNLVHHQFKISTRRQSERSKRV